VYFGIVSIVSFAFVGSSSMGAQIVDDITSEHPWRLAPWAKGELVKVQCEGLPEETAEERLNSLVSSRRFVALSLPNCPQCEELAGILAQRGVDASKIFVKWDKQDEQYPNLKAALSKHAGQLFTFPQVFADGKYEGGFNDVSARLASGTYDHIFEESYGGNPLTVQRYIQERAMVVFSVTPCPQCDVLRERLAGRGLPVEELFVKWDKGAPAYQSLKAQLMKITGLSQFSFPQTFVSGKFCGSFPEVTQELQTGGLDEFFQKTFGVSPAAAVQPAEQVLCLDEDF
jgi:glutaredoxin